MNNHQLTWLLQDNNIITKYQKYFLESTVDHLVRLVTYIPQGFTKIQQTIEMLFDIEKACGRVHMIS